MISRALPVSPVANRLGLLDGHPRHAAVLKVAAEQAGWGTSLPKGRGLGVAVHESFHSFVAQMEGGIGYTLGAALRDKVTLTNGVVDQSNFHDYEPLCISDMPKIDVHIVASDAPPSGVGEPGVPRSRRVSPMRSSTTQQKSCAAELPTTTSTT
jgi:isoquinoline 1-oxidoreductase beta subunit